MTSKQAIEELIKEREYAYTEKVNHKTETWSTDIKHYDNITECINAIEKDLNRLVALEGKIENGTLVELPCKVGDTVYEIDYNRDACYECQYFSSFFGMDTECEKDFDIYPDLNTSEIVCDKHFLEVSPIRFSLAFYERNMGNFNKTWFLTKAEAEDKLRELEVLK